MELKVKVWIERDGALCFGRGRAQLLDAIAQTGSISAAARKIGMSYRHAWTMLRASERRLGGQLAQRVRGGSGGGGARLTPWGTALLEGFRTVESAFLTLAREKQHEVEALGG